MSIGKYLSLEEACKDKKLLERFIKEHPSEGDEAKFNRIFKALVEKNSTDSPKKLD